MGNTETVVALVKQCKANANARADNGRTAIFGAAQEGFTETVSFRTKSEHAVQAIVQRL